jgi:hypothetical protein
MEKTVDCTQFVEKVEQIIVYAKMLGINAKISHSVVFNWLAMINDDSNYEPYHVEEEVLTKGDFSDSDLKYIIKELYKTHKVFLSIVDEFEDKKNYIVSLNYDEEVKKADLSIYKDEPNKIYDFDLDEYQSVYKKYMPQDTV